MKKFTFILFGLFLIVATANAQDPLTLSWEGEPIEGDVTVFGDQNDAEIISYANVTNNTGESMNIKVRRNRIYMEPGSSSQFCWAGLCYPPMLDESPGFQTLAPGETSASEDFSGHYIPNGAWGASQIEYEFFNADDETVSVKMMVTFSATVSGFEDNTAASFSMYPNPVQDQLTLEANSRIEKVSVFDITGKEVYSIPTDNNKVVVNVNFLERGIYLVKLETERGTRVEKLNKR